MHSQLGSRNELLAKRDAILGVRGHQQHHLESAQI
jgi:hypothetical protein